MNKFLFTFIVFSMLPNQIQAQVVTRKMLRGKVNAYANSLSGIYVINTSTEKASITEENGYFAIPAKEGDTLMLSSINFKGLKYAITKETSDQDLFFVKMLPLMHQLDEVQVFQYKNINAVALGIIPKGQKTYTPAERRYKTATGLDAQIGLNTSLTIDPLFNLLSGRSAMLRKAIDAERKELMMDKIDNTFEHDYFVQKLKIPEEYVRGFYYYIVENKRFTDAMNSKNKAMATFVMGELAVAYIEMNNLGVCKE